MKVAVTGGAGFIGSHVVRLLLAHRHDVLILDNLESGSRQAVPANATFVRCDVRDGLMETLTAFGPEVVIHLAAQTSVPVSVEQPLHDMEANLVGTLNVLNAAAASGARKLVFASSAAVYGDVNAELIVENQPQLRPLSPYGLSKRCAEEYIRNLAARYGLKYTIIRPANVYGPGQRAGGDGSVIPNFVQSFLAGESPVIYGDGTQVRDFVYIDDLARAFMFALTRGDNRVLNVSSGVGCSIADLWQMMASIAGWTRPAVHGPARAGDVASSVLANAWAEAFLGWVPAVSLMSGLRETLAWAEGRAPLRQAVGGRR